MGGEGCLAARIRIKQPEILDKQLGIARGNGGGVKGALVSAQAMSAEASNLRGI